MKTFTPGEIVPTGLNRLVDGDYTDVVLMLPIMIWFFRRGFDPMRHQPIRGWFTFRVVVSLSGRRATFWRLEREASPGKIFEKRGFEWTRRADI